MVDIRAVPGELLLDARLPAAGKFVRSAFDQNLDGLDHRPWRDLKAKAEAKPVKTEGEEEGSAAAAGDRPAGMDAYFNYGLDENSWVVRFSPSLLFC